MKIPIPLYIIFSLSFLGLSLCDTCSPVTCIHFEGNNEVEYCDNCMWKWTKDEQTGNCTGHPGPCGATLISLAVILFVFCTGCIVAICVKYGKKRRNPEGFTRFGEDDPFHQ